MCPCRWDKIRALCGRSGPVRFGWTCWQSAEGWKSKWADSQQILWGIPSRETQFAQLIQLCWDSPRIPFLHVHIFSLGVHFELFALTYIDMLCHLLSCLYDILWFSHHYCPLWRTPSVEMWKRVARCMSRQWACHATNQLWQIEWVENG